MSTPIQIPLEAIKRKHEQLSNRLVDTSLDRTERQQLQKELSHLSSVLRKSEEIEETQKSLQSVSAQMSKESDESMIALYQEEMHALKVVLARQERELSELIVPESEHDKRSVYLEIRAGTGGQEAALFAADLMRMYMQYALKKGWRVSVSSESFTDLGGYREVVLHIEGKDVYGHLKYESGAHRVQRVPTTETSGRVHTSTATVAVLPEAEEVDVTINPADLRIDVYRSSGAGGQHVNTTDSAVRITHIPTGVVVACQDERSQHKNKAKAMKILQSRLLAAQMEKQAQEMSKQRKEQMGTGVRAEKVRTYNFPQNRITDHQIDMTLKNLDMVMEGNLDEIINELRAREYESRKQQCMTTFSA